MALSEQKVRGEKTDSNLVYVNGISMETGDYAFVPRPIEDIAEQVLARPGVNAFDRLRCDQRRSVPFDMDPNRLDQSGWGIVFHEAASHKTFDALETLIALRRKQAGERFKQLDFKNGEQARNWYTRHGIAPGLADPEIVPYFLLLIGSPELIP